MLPLIFIIIVRLLIPFTVFRWPFWGAIAIIAADAFDFGIINAAGPGLIVPFSYQGLDKVLDLYALIFQFHVISLLIEIKARNILKILFSWRILGIILFELTGIRQLLFFAPNIFSFFYLLVFGVKEFTPSFSLEDNRNLVILFIIAAIPKLILEYILHFKEYPLGLRRAWQLMTGTYH